jgi:hypothetical protein
MNDAFGVTYEQLQPKLFLFAGPSVTKHGPNTHRAAEAIKKVEEALWPKKLIGTLFCSVSSSFVITMIYDMNIFLYSGPFPTTRTVRS